MKTNIKAQLQDLLEIALIMERAHKGFIQTYDSENELLELSAHKGFTQEFIDHFRTVKILDSLTAVKEIGICSTVIINDINKYIKYKEYVKFDEMTDYVVLKSLSIITYEQKRIGRISIFFKKPSDILKPDRLVKISKELIRLLDKE